MKIHPIFNVSFFEPYITIDILKSGQMSHDPIEMNNNQVFEIDEVLDSRKY